MKIFSQCQFQPLPGSLLLLLLSGSLRVTAIPSTVNIEIPVPAKDALLRSLDRNLVSWSIQNRDLPMFTRSKLLENLFKALATNIGIGQSVRLGGGESDKTTYGSDITITADKYRSGYYGAQAQGNVTLGPNYFASFKEKYAPDTRYIWCLNLINTTNKFDAAISTAAGVLEYLGDELDLFEIGNEADFYGSKGFRDSEWDASMMLPEWNYIADEIQKNSPNKTVRFMAGGFANPAYIVTKDFDIPGIIAAGYQSSRIPWYSMHLYPQSGCSGAVTIAPLLEHNTLSDILSNYIPQVAAAESVGAQFAIGETNTVSCVGRPGISDTFAAALWLVDYVLFAATIGIRRVYFHATTTGSYSPVIPINYSLDSGNYSTGVLPLSYGAYFISEVLSFNDTLLIMQIEGGNDTDYSSYSVWDETNKLRKIVFINLQSHNSSTGGTNPATPDTEVYSSSGPRPSTRVTVATPWEPGQELSLIRLQAPGSNSKSQVNVSSFTFSEKDGSVTNNLVDTIITVKDNGNVEFDLLASEAVLVQHYSDVLSNKHPTKSGSKAADSTVNGVVMRTRGANMSISSVLVLDMKIMVSAILVSALLAFI
ncbi:hypothetical protein AOL_s00043g809 [Orbilia oligospora ATCC 24927]|uniref:Beta-glucuronidase C-terminal domain-containing protein n=1 Tax=Arthrobotrys oligospora (strain ATCC 24927 / CBS 115.81 / DSM 1491) TaxID=756982 RepID=G1X535_ARTOA|nr:hypothetical protein AOL_s00043g809 [Orbilia oligospora ATCC 24927]EGX51790.1 hypothetical protein AOL_s00043g809 [Orbilia oligospora ATCC 24927]